ncbi:hypothetical protein CANCADRAFT_784 [Tortispora caseinolytica NRRL Y-17796]|uniref:Enhancer of mRNA-decapping protein 3 n=1 Tax=Tortispora caseinolytica NRRL Y-17796 TaxID=767744 RepID=A0A1E4TKD9_9ASCO|nr:hypothetical protein CANCADRAFT_784 [Tortispora caseinolytica NRRL Y-17796]
MASQFLGLPVSIVHNIGTNIYGVIEGVDGTTLKLKNVKINDQAIDYDYEIDGSDILDLQVLREQKTPREKPKKSKKSPAKTAPMNGPIKLITGSGRKENSRSGTGSANGDIFATGNHSDNIQDDFDFEANLNKFDKKGVFDEFKKQDTSTSRLVDNNRISAKYRHDENVLSDSSVISADVSKKLQLKIEKGGRFCPLANPLQIIELEREAFMDFGLSEETLTENSGRTICSLVLELLGGSRRMNASNHNSPPLVTIFCGIGRSGLRGLAAARHLLNHDIHVVVCKPATRYSDDASILREVQRLEKLGVTVSEPNLIEKVLDEQEAPTELIIDALAGIEFSILDMFGGDPAPVEDTYKMIEWINRKRISKLSIDLPAGLDSSTGDLCARDSEGTIGQCIEPKWVLSLGIPVSSLVYWKNKWATGHSECHFYVGDIGIPRAAFQSRSMKRLGQLRFGPDYYLKLVQG